VFKEYRITSFSQKRQHFVGKHFKFVKTDTSRIMIALQKHHQLLEAPQNRIVQRQMKLIFVFVF